MNLKNNFFELPIPTRDGQFVARYSEKGLAELNFPNGRVERAAPARRAQYAQSLPNRRFPPKSDGIAQPKPR